MGWAAAFCGAGVLAALAYPQTPFVVLAAVLLGYLGASWLVETMRIESDKPSASRMLPYRYGNLIQLHVLVPAALVAAALALSCAAGVLTGISPGPALPLARTMCLVAAVGLGEVGGFVLVQWYAVGPILALLALGVPGLALAVASGGSFPPWTALLGATAYSSLFAGLGFWWLGKRRPPG